MTRRAFRLGVVLTAVTLSLILAPSLAYGQDAPDYPGPFGEQADDTSTDAATDEVQGQSIDEADPADQSEGTSEGTQPLHERSIDYLGDDAATMFAAPDISLPASAAGGTGGGLAVTGSEVEPIVAISVGLLAVGGSVLVSSRRRLRDLFS